MLQSVLPSVSQAKGSAALCSVFFGEWLNARFEQLCDGHRLLQFAIPPPFLLLLLPPPHDMEECVCQGHIWLGSTSATKEEEGTALLLFRGAGTKEDDPRGQELHH